VHFDRSRVCRRRLTGLSSRKADHAKPRESEGYGRNHEKSVAIAAMMVGGYFRHFAFQRYIELQPLKSSNQTGKGDTTRRWYWRYFDINRPY